MLKDSAVLDKGTGSRDGFSNLRSLSHYHVKEYMNVETDSESTPI